MKNYFKQLRALLALTVGAFVLFTNLSAATLYWDGISSSWNTLGNWSTDSAAATPDPVALPGALDDLSFNISTVNGAQSITLDANQSARSLTFNNTGSTMFLGGASAQTLTFGTGGITIGASSGAVTFGDGTATNDVLLSLASGAQTWTNNSASNFTFNNISSTFSRATGSTINFNKLGAGDFVVTSGVANDATGIIGNWATFGTGANQRYATVSAGNIAGYTGTTANTEGTWTSATANYEVTTTTAQTLTASRTANTMRYSGTGLSISLGASGANTLTLNGILAVGASGAFTITRSGTSTGTVVIGSSNELVIHNTQQVNLNGAPITGLGGITKSGSGLLVLGANPAATHTYSGVTTINGGVVQLQNNKGAGNWRINEGMVTGYTVGSSFTSGLGTGNNQIQIYGNSGFGGGNGTSTWTIGTANSTLIWGALGEGSATGFFNPTTLKFLTAPDNMGPTTYGSVKLDNGLNLNGAARTIDVLAASGVNALVSSYALFDDAIIGTGSSSIIKTGGGNLILSATNSYANGTAINNGMVRFDTRLSMPATGTVTVADGATLGVTVAGTGTTWGSGTTAAGIAGLTSTANSGEGYGGQAGAIVNFNGNSRLLLNVTGNVTESNQITNGTATSIALIKTGASTLTLTSGSNSYSGGTILIQGALAVGHNSALGGGTLALNGGTIQSDSATARTISNAVTIGGDFTVGGTGNMTFSNTGASALGATRQITVGTGINATFAQAFSGGGITKAGAGTLTLTGNNTYTGATTISAGTLVLNNDGDVTSSAVAFSGGNSGLTITGGSSVTSIWNNNGGAFGGSNGTSLNNVQVLIDGAGTAGSARLTNVTNLNWGGQFGGTGGSLTNSTLSLTNGGQMTVSGEIRLGSTYYSTGGGANITIGGGTATSTFTGNSGQAFYIGFGDREGSNNNVVTVNSGGVLTSIGNMFVGHVNNTQGAGGVSTANKLTVTGTGTASMTSISVGYAQSGDAAGSANANVVEVTNGGTLTTSGVNYIGRINNTAGATSNGNTMTVTGTGSTWNAGGQNVIIGSAVASSTSNNNVLTVGVGGVVSNVGALTVGSATGTSTGNQLVVNGSLTATSVTVRANNSLSGSGTINGAVTVNGNYRPGQSPGTMTFQNILTLTSTSVSTIEIDGNNGAGVTGGHDFTNLTGVGAAGVLTYGGAMTLDIGAVFGTGVYTWNLFDMASETGTFATVTLADQYSGSLLDADLDGVWNLTSGNDTWVFTESTGVLGLTVIPEPKAALLGALGILLLLRRRRV